MQENNLENNKLVEELKVSLSYGDLRAEFSGSPESVLHSINSFISKQLPQLELAKKLLLNYNSADLANKFQAYVKITPEGPRVMTHDDLTDKEYVCLRLVAQKIAYDSRYVKDPGLSISGIEESTSLNSKTLSSRLSELSKGGQVVRESGEGGTTFRISTQGISWLKDTLEKKRPPTT